MAGSQLVSITITGADELSRALGSKAKRLSDLSEPMKDIGTHLSKYFSSEVFASRGGAIGEPWKPLSPAYAAWKARAFPGRPPLVRSGEMQRGFYAESGTMFARISNKSDHFDFHQGGTSKMPARVMMKVDEQRAQAIRQIIERYVSSVLEAA